MVPGCLGGWFRGAWNNAGEETGLVISNRRNSGRTRKKFVIGAEEDGIAENNPCCRVDEESRGGAER